MVCRNDGHSYGQTTLTDVEDGARGSLTEVNGSQRKNRKSLVCTALGNGGHITRGVDHDVLGATAGSVSLDSRLCLISEFSPSK